MFLSHLYFIYCFQFLLYCHFILEWFPQNGTTFALHYPVFARKIYAIMEFSEILNP
ncbi:hypothetical protein ACJX0J_029595, partial [Zea mays]